MFTEQECNNTKCELCKIINTDNCATRINNEFYIGIDAYELSVLYDRFMESSYKSRNIIWKCAYVTIANAILSLRFLVNRYEQSK